MWVVTCRDHVIGKSCDHDITISYTLFKLNYDYHPRMLYREKVDSRSKSKSTDKLSAELRELMIVCWENLHHAQKFQKRAHNKGVKPKSYAPGDKICLKSKYIKTKYNQKLEGMFFGSFQMLHPVRKQTYELELLKKWRIHDVFHISLLEQVTIKKGRIDKEVKQIELDAGDNDSGEYEVEAIRNSAVNTRELESSHLSGLYYVVLWKVYP